jgi:hypothetical protein
MSHVTVRATTTRAAMDWKLEDTREKKWNREMKMREYVEDFVFGCSIASAVPERAATLVDN